MDARRKEHNIAGNFKSIPVKLARMLALAHVYNFAYHACLVDIHYSSGREGQRHDLAISCRNSLSSIFLGCVIFAAEFTEPLFYEPPPEKQLSTALRA